MRTIVVFQVSKSLFYAELEDLVSRPVKDACYVRRGQRYKVIDVTEFLGVTTSDETRKASGNDKLLEILGTMFDEEVAIALFAKLHNIGSKSTDTQTAGGIFLPGSKEIGDFDHVLFVRLEAEHPAAIPTLRLTAITEAGINSLRGATPSDDDPTSQGGSANG